MGYEYVPASLPVDFALQVHGDSMIGARIYDKDIVFFRKQDMVETGEIAAVQIDGQEYTSSGSTMTSALSSFEPRTPCIPRWCIGKQTAGRCASSARPSVWCSCRDERRLPMAYIEKRPNGTYRAHVFVGTDENGKKVKQYVTKPTRRECKVAADDMERRIREGAVSSSNIRTLPLSVYADRWFEANRSRLAPSTRKAYRMYIDLHITPTPIGPKRLCDITETDIMEWLAANKKNAACTIRKHFFLLQDIMGAALKGANPCIGVKPPKAEDYIPVVPTREEFKALHDAVRGTKDELPILLIAKCGMRPGEIFALEWADIDFDRMMIRVDEALSVDEKGGKYVEKDPKSRKGKREVAAPADVLQLLKDKRAKSRVIGHPDPVHPAGLVHEAIQQEFSISS